MVCFAATLPNSNAFNKSGTEVVVAKIAEKETKYKLLKKKCTMLVDSKLIHDHGVHSNGWQTCAGNH